MGLRYLMVLMVVLFAGLAPATAQVNTQPIRIDNSDGCGQQRVAVDVGRDSIRRDRFYKETDRWFQDRLAALQKCIDDIPRRRAQAAAERNRWETNKSDLTAKASSILWWTLGLGLPLAIFLSYAQSAGVAGNGALVRLRDWKGSPIFIWAACAVAAGLFYAGILSRFSQAYGTRDLAADGGMLLAMFAMLAVLGIALALTWAFVANDLWPTLKGIAILLHYLFARHPAQAHLPSSATDALVRRDFGRVMREHGLGLKGIWRELMTPSPSYSP